MLITNMQAAVGAGGTHDVIPPAGQEWLIRDVANDVAFVANVPDMMVALRDGIHADAYLFIHPAFDPGRRQRQLELYLTNAVYMRLTNTGGVAGNLSWIGERVTAGLSINNIVTVGAIATVNIQPPAGQTWRITEWGASAFTGIGDINPYVDIGITDGTLVASRIVHPNMMRGQDKAYDWIIDNATYLNVTDIGGGGVDFGYSGRREPYACISNVQDVAGGGTLDIQPPAGQEWVVTEIAAETWGGAGAPNNYPDIGVSIRVGANNSDILEAGSVATSLRWNQRLFLPIDNTHWLRITEVSGGNNEVGFLGFLRRSYS
jgi:hypothetical protein